MATTVLKDTHIGVTSYSNSSTGYHEARFYTGGISYDSVTRSGNTVTLTNVKVKSYVRWQLVNGGNTGNFGFSSTYYGWIGIWKNSDTTYAGSTPLGKTGTHVMGAAGVWYTDNPRTIVSGDINIGNISFTVSGSGAGTYTLKVGYAFSRNNSNGVNDNGRDSSDPTPTFTVSYPANAFKLNVNVMKGTSEDTTGATGKFDIYVPDTTKVGSQVSDYNQDVTSGTKYKINNITEQSADWYFTGSSSYTGTITAAKTIELPFSATSVPTGLDAALVSRAWNQVVAKATITGFGAPSNRASRSISVGVAASTGTAWSNCYTTQSTTAATATGNKTFTHANLVGCAAFKLGAYATNTKKTASVLESTVYYLPPHPMASVTLNSTTRNDKNVTFNVKAIGAAADGTNNVSGAKVNLQYRYSTDGGATYTSWANAATNYTPNTAKTFNLNIKYNTAVKVQVRQATYQDTAQVTAALTLDIAEVHPIPKDPTLTFSWDELDRIFTSIATNTGTGGDTGDSSLKRLEYQVSWNSNFSSPFVNTTPTASPYTYTISYLKPLRTLYVRVRTVNNWDLTSNWVSVSPTVPRPLWGLVKGTSEVTGNVETIEIRDMVKVKTDNTVSARDWIEGTNNGKKRIVKN